VNFNTYLPSYPNDIHQFFSRWTPLKKLMFAALLAAIAAVFQSFGGLLPAIGYLLSPFSTLPIMLAMLASFRSGVLTYILTICLLLVMEPSELVIFPFTTGLLGLGLGWTFLSIKHPLGIVITNGALLCIGICIPLYGFGFPIFGSYVSPSFTLIPIVVLSAFSLLYSWIWFKFGLFILRKIKAILFVI
jgi:hypothetical protein